jgi:tripartite-type tricarboxylate transporter receptor subunit TctC
MRLDCLSLILGLLSLGVSSAAMGQAAGADFPSRPVTLIIPYPGSSSLDTEFRIYTQSIQDATGRQFIHDYKGGAGTTIGTAYVAKALPDGYTLLAVMPPFSINPAVYKDLPYDNIRDFAHIALLSRQSNLMVAHANAPFRNVAEYLAFARANPGKINYATSGLGGSSHLAGEWLHYDSHTKATFVHYKAPNQRIVDLVAGRVDVTSGGYLALSSMIKSGKLRVLGVTSKERVPGWDFPTIAEQGVPTYDYTSYVGLTAPARTPPSVVARLNEMFVNATRDPNVVKKLDGDGKLMTGSSPQQFRDFVLADTNRWKRMIDELGLKIEAE